MNIYMLHWLLTPFSPGIMVCPPWTWGGCGWA